MTDHPAPPPEVDVAGLRAEVEHLRARAAEAAALRGELLTLRAERQEQLDQLQRQVARLAGTATSAQARTTRQLQSQLEEARAGESRARRRADKLRERVRALENARSHRAAQYARRALTRFRPEPAPPAPQPGRTTGAATGRRPSEASPTPTVAGDTAAGREPVPNAAPPPVLLDCRGLGREDLARALAETAETGTLAGEEVVVLIDSVDFDLPRSRGQLVEYVPPVATVAYRLGEEAAARMESTRWSEIVNSHRPREVYRAVHADGGLRLDLLVARPGPA